MEGMMALSAQDQGLALPCDHDLFPLGEPISLLGQVVDLSDVVALDMVVGATGLARVREKPFHDLGSIVPDRFGRVIQDYTWFSSKGDAAPSRYEWRFPVPFHGNPQDLIGTILSPVHSSELADALWHGDLQLGCQRLGQGGLHDPPQPRTGARY